MQVDQSAPPEQSAADLANAELTRLRQKLAEDGERKKRIDAERDKVTKAIEELKETQAGKGRGRKPGSYKSKLNLLESKLKRLDDNYLPGEVDRPDHPRQRAATAGPARDELVRSAGEHADKHTDCAHPPVGRGKVKDHAAQAQPTAEGEDLTKGAKDHEECLPGHEFRGLYHINAGQSAFVAHIIGQIQGQADGHNKAAVFRQRSSAVFEPPDPAKDPRFIGAVRTTVFAPKEFYGKDEFTVPCPYGCGWDSRVNAQYYSNGRVMCGLTQDEHLIGKVQFCMDCKNKRATAKEKGRPHKHIHYKFVNYHPKCWEMFWEKHPDVMARYPFVLTSFRTGLTLDAAVLYRSSIPAGLNPHALAEILKEMRCHWRLRIWISVFGMVSKGLQTSQHTIQVVI